MTRAFRNMQSLVSTYGVTVASLRLFEGRGLIQPVLIGGVRYYTPMDRVRLEVVLKGKRLGFSLDEIEKLVNGTTLPSTSTAPRETRPDPDRLIDELRVLTDRRTGLDLLIDALKAKLSDI